MDERTPVQILAAIDQARAAVAEGDEAVAAYLLEVPVEDVQRVTGH